MITLRIIYAILLGLAVCFVCFIVGYIIGKIDGYKEAEKDILSIIQSRLEEIPGDAQPRPVLRMELQELINKIENGDN